MDATAKPYHLTGIHCAYACIHADPHFLHSRNSCMDATAMPLLLLTGNSPTPQQLPHMCFLQVDEGRLCFGAPCRSKGRGYELHGDSKIKCKGAEMDDDLAMHFGIHVCLYVSGCIGGWERCTHVWMIGTHTHAHTRARARAHTHTHTHTRAHAHAECAPGKGAHSPSWPPRQCPVVLSTECMAELLSCCGPGLANLQRRVCVCVRARACGREGGRRQGEVKRRLVNICSFWVCSVGAHGGELGSLGGAWGVLVKGQTKGATHPGAFQQVVLRKLGENFL